MVGGILSERHSLQFSSRFWETEDQIYGGMSFTNNSQIGTIAYPDYNYQEQKGAIQGAWIQLPKLTQRAQQMASRRATAGS